MINEILKQQLFELIQKYNLSISTAESCTGGLVAAKLCEIPGISSYFEEGYITYSCRAKTKILAVPDEIIQTYGVVSCETAAKMAEGASDVSGSDCSISTTGIAGPSGGTTDTPVGCVCFACTVKGKTKTIRHIFDGNRQEIREDAANYALEFLCKTIKEEIISCVL